MYEDLNPSYATYIVGAVATGIFTGLLVYYGISYIKQHKNKPPKKENNLEKITEDSQ